MCKKRLSKLWSIFPFVVSSLLAVILPVTGEPIEELQPQLPTSNQNSQNEIDLLNLLDSLSDMLLTEATASTLESKESRMQLEKLLEQQKSALLELEALKTEASELKNSLAESQSRYERSIALSKEAEQEAIQALQEAEANRMQKEKSLHTWKIVGLSGWGTSVVLFLILLF